MCVSPNVLSAAVVAAFVLVVPSADPLLAPLSPPDAHHTGAASSTLKAAADAWGKKDIISCQTLAQDALTQGELSVDETAQAWLLRGTCYALGGDADRAQRSDAVAVRIKRNATLPDGTTPADDAWKQALQTAPPPERALSARASVDGDSITTELVVDDLQLVKSAMLLKADEELARFPLSASEAKHKVSGIPVDDIALVLLDKHANQIAKLTITAASAVTPVANATPVTTTNAPATNAQPTTTATTTATTFAKPRHAATLLTILGSSAVVLGAAGVVVSGVEVAGYGSSALDKGQPWLIGAGASSGLFLVGASLLVVDQGLD